jgi:hypothetical protein
MANSIQEEKRPVRAGSSGELPTPMTRRQALRWGEQNMPKDLKRAGWTCSVFASDAEIHGGLWFRVNYSYGSRVLDGVRH